MKKWLSWLVLVACLIGSVGCASVQKKFTRKKKEPKYTPSVIPLQQGPYQKKYSNEYYYKTHFTLWKTWQDELLIQLGRNQKKIERCAQEALGHLTEMSNYLVPEAQAALEPEISALEKVARRIESGYSSSEEGVIRVELERIKRVVSSGFYYDKVKDKVVAEAVDVEPVDTVTPPSA